MNLRNRWVQEQQLDESTDHGTSKTATQLFCVGQELIDSSGSRIGFLFPPSLARADGDVGLNQTDGLMVEDSDVRMS